MERWVNRVAVVTGASSGIGAAITKDLVKAGLIVVGLARRKERIDEIRDSLDETEQERLYVYRCDVSDLEAVNMAFDWIEETLGGVDVMINNAGMIRTGQLLNTDVAILQQTLQTNLMAMVYCTQRAFQSMRKRNVKDGHVILINSILGHTVINPPPGSMSELNIYPPTKFAITALTEILRQEFRDLDTQIKITVRGFFEVNLIYALENNFVFLFILEHQSWCSGD